MLKVKVWKDLSLSLLFIFTGISPPNKNKCFILFFTIDSFASLTKNYCSSDLDKSLNCPLAAGNPAKVSPIVNKIGWRNGNKWNFYKIWWIKCTCGRFYVIYQTLCSFTRAEFKPGTQCVLNQSVVHSNHTLPFGHLGHSPSPCKAFRKGGTKCYYNSMYWHFFKDAYSCHGKVKVKIV